MSLKFIQIYTKYNSKNEPSCKLWTLNDNHVSVEVHQLQQMYPFGGLIIESKKETVWGQGIDGKSLHLPFHFALNLKWL